MQLERSIFQITKQVLLEFSPVSVNNRVVHLINSVEMKSISTVIRLDTTWTTWPELAWAWITE